MSYGIYSVAAAQEGPVAELKDSAAGFFSAHGDNYEGNCREI